jgi:hypothetical protein
MKQTGVSAKPFKGEDLQIQRETSFTQVNVTGWCKRNIRQKDVILQIQLITYSFGRYDNNTGVRTVSVKKISALTNPGDNIVSRQTGT